MTQWQPKQHGNYYERQAYRELRKEQIKAEKAAKDKDAMTCQCCGRRIFAQTGTIAHHGYERPAAGWQTASCMGAKHLPFEVARDRLADLIERLKRDIETTRRHLDNVKNEKVEVPFFWTSYEKDPKRRFSTKSISHHKLFSRGEFDALCEAINSKMLPLLREHTIYGKEYKAAEEALQPMDAALWGKLRPSSWDDRWVAISFNDLKEAEIQSTAARLTQLRSFRDEQQARYDGWQQTHTHFDKETENWILI